MDTKKNLPAQAPPFERDVRLSDGAEESHVRFAISPERASILVVDDHPPNLLALQAVLEPLGHEVITARSGEEALERLGEREYAVILMDVRMPGLDGYQTAARVRDIETARHTPIIFLTAHASDEEQALRAYERSAVDFLVKPFNPEILASKVRIFVELYLRGQTIRRHEAALREAEREALERQSETRFQTIIDLMPLCVVALHPDGTPYFCNRAWREYTGIAIDDASGDMLLEAIHRDDKVRTREALREAMSGGREIELECRIRCGRDGAFRWHVVRALPELGTTGKIVSWIATATDIERQKKAEEHAKTANRTKDEFLAMVSHDLRTPLTAILGWVGLLLAGHSEPAKVKRGLETIQRNARAQAILIDDVLDVARMLSGNLRLEERAVDVRAIVEGALDPVRAAAEAKHIDLHTTYHPVPTTVGDPARLQQVVWNLAMNAVKFTPEQGKVEVAVRPADGHIEIEITDTGRGIDADFLPHVFDRFRQAAGSPTKREGGLGVGLAIVHHIVQLHHGAVSAQSGGPGRGSTFAVRIPVRTPSAGESVEAAVSERSPSPAPLLEGVRILVVDDDGDTRTFLSQVLGAAGAEVVTASTSGEARESFRSAAPDVLVCDIGLPGQDGYSFIQEVRALAPDEGGRLPAAALTAHTRVEDASRALEAGFDRHVGKPVEPVEVVQIVAELAARARSRQS
jgi:PAS domain S-box-containing protein